MTQPQANTVENQPDQALTYLSELEADESTETFCSHEEAVLSPTDDVNILELPPFVPANPCNQFKWGKIDG